MIEINSKGIYETKRAGKDIILTYENNTLAAKAYMEYTDKLLDEIKEDGKGKNNKKET